MKKYLLIFSVLSISCIIMNSEVFKFQYTQGQKQRIECTIHGAYLINGLLQSEYDQEYKTVNTVNKIEGNIANLDEETFFYLNYTTNTINQVNQIVKTNYSKDQRGIMTVKKNDIFPTFRNIPIFPEQNIEKGFKWNMSGFEAQNIFGDGYVTLFPADVYYEFVGYEKLDGKNCALFNYEFTVDMANNGKNDMDPRISRVLGNSKTEMYFDNKSGSKVKENYESHYFFVVTDGTSTNVAEFMFEGSRIWYPVELMQKDKIISDLNKDLKDKKIDDTTIQKDEKGIKISLENIQFEPESSVLLSPEKARLDKISEILKKYKDRGIMIVGHTTDKGTEEGRQRLSIERAKVVTEYLLKNNAIDPAKSAFYGKGGTEPLADNNTESGMKKNRRVEIYILEE
jgi:outer membrane protein OmpA-like peptidoglycan-associated protein